MTEHDKFCPFMASVEDGEVCNFCSRLGHARADEDEKIALAIEREMVRLEYQTGLFHRIFWPSVRMILEHTARIARSGGRDE